MGTPLEVVATINGPTVGVVENPTMLDGPLSWAAWQHAASTGAEIPPIEGDFDLPLEKWGDQDGIWGWCTSAASVKVESWSGAELRRRPAVEQMSRFTTASSHHSALGPYKARDSITAVAWVSTITWQVDATNVGRFHALLALITHVGKNHSIGFGHVTSWKTVPGPRRGWEDRPMPSAEGQTMGVRAPYWLFSRKHTCAWLR